jgi:hypothetical protein
LRSNRTCTACEPDGISSCDDAACLLTKSLELAPELEESIGPGCMSPASEAALAAPEPVRKAALQWINKKSNNENKKPEILDSQPPPGTGRACEERSGPEAWAKLSQIHVAKTVVEWAVDAERD